MLGWKIVQLSIGIWKLNKKYVFKILFKDQMVPKQDKMVRMFIWDILWDMEVDEQNLVCTLA